MLGIKELAASSGISYSSLRKMAIAGKIPCIKIGNRYKFADDVLEKVIQQQTQKRKEEVDLNDSKKIGKKVKSFNFMAALKEIAVD